MLIKQQKRKVPIGIIILCRYNSSRLPGKILLEIRGKTVLAYIYERLSCSKIVKDIVVATSREKDDEPIVAFCKNHKIECFRGSKQNVALRMLQCARRYQFDYFIRICGDNLLVDCDLLDKMARIALQQKYNFISNVKNRTFSSGMSIEILKTDFYEKIIKQFKNDEYKEHATIYLYQHEDEIGPYYYLYNTAYPKARNIKLALDDNNDLDFLNRIIKKMKYNHTDYHFKDIYKLAKSLSWNMPHK